MEAIRPHHEKAPKAIDDALRCIHKITRDRDFSFNSSTHSHKYVGALSAHIASWGAPPDVAADISHRIFKLHGAVTKKVDRFLRENYGYGIRDYDYDIELLRNALIRVYGDASSGFLKGISKDVRAKEAYINALDATAQAVQPNFAITDHVIREGYSIAPYAALLRDYPFMSQLIDRALRRRYPRIITDLRHMLDVFFMSNHTDKYLAAAEKTIHTLLSTRGIKSGRIPRQHITPYAAAIVPFALHAALIDVPPKGDAHKALHEVSHFIFGNNGTLYLPKLRMFAQDPDLYPVLIGFAKHWDKNLNDRAWDAFVQAMKYGKHNLRDFVHTEGRVAWGDLWPHLSRSTIHTFRETDERHDFVSISKLNVLDQIRGLTEQPTCLYPANEQGQRYGLEYVFNPKKGEVMPLIAVAHGVSKKKGGTDRILGRVVMFADPKHGNMHIVSTPVGGVPLEHYIEAAKRYAEEVNRSVGQDIFQRIIVGGQGNATFRVPVDDAYADMIVKKDGRHYLRDAKVIKIK